MKAIGARRLSFRSLGGSLCGVLLLSCGLVLAQSTAQINGIITDQSGAVLPGVEVVATQTDTGFMRTMVTNETGSYVLANLPVGPYRLEAALPGFRTYVQTGIVLQVGANPTINAVLQVGQVSDQIEVQANAALVETRNTGIGQVIDNSRVLELPLNGRNAAELVLLGGMATIGSTQLGGGNALDTVRNYPTIVIAVAGGIPNGVVYLLDGANHNDPFNNLGLPLPFPDALQEFKVETSALPAQYGFHSSAVVNAVTKSGTNQFHGDTFEFLRNGNLNARNAFALIRDSLKRNQFGGTFGGPLTKDKLFFFAGYQDTSERSAPTQSVAYIPTPAMLAGDFTTITSAVCNAGRPVVLKPPFVNNRLDPSLLNPATLKITARLFPDGTPTPCGQVTYGLRHNLDEHLLATRMDYVKNEKHSLFGRFTLAKRDRPSTYDGKSMITNNTHAQQARVYSLALGDTYLIGGGIVSSLRISLSRTTNRQIGDKMTTWADVGVKASSFTAPVINVSAPGSFQFGSGNSIGKANSGPLYNVAEDLSVVKGAHQYGFGAHYNYSLMNYVSSVNSRGTMTFSGQTTGLSLADFLIGKPSQWQ